MSRLGFPLLLLVLWIAQTTVVLAADPQDWPNWLGPNQDRTSTETGLPEKWNPAGGPKSNVLWKNEELATRSTPVVMKGRLYTLARAEPGTPREGERVVCADAATGEILWENRFNVYLSDVPDTRVAWSSVVGDPETGNVYALGVCGFFQCIDGQTGKTLWSHSLHEEYGLLSTYGGRTNFPVIYNDLVIVSAVVIGWGDTPATGLMAKPAHRFMAFDKKTGQMVWLNGTRLIPYDTTYSTPTFTKLGVQWALVFGSGDGQVWAMQPATGEHIWNYPLSRRGLNISPLVVDQTVYMGHDQENLTGARMGAIVALDATGRGDLGGENREKHEIWRHDEVTIGKSSPVLVHPDDKTQHIYALDNGGVLFIFDAQTGKRVLRKSLGGSTFSTPLVADGKVYVATTRYWLTLKPLADGVKILARVRWPRGEEMLGSPIVSNRRIYIPTTGAMYCVGMDDVPKKESGTTQSAQRATDSASAETVSKRPTSTGSAKPAHVQVVPCEVLLKPGEKQAFKVRLFDDKGRFIKKASAMFTVAGAGKVDDSGVYTAPNGDEHTTAVVTAKIGNLEGKARVRVVPPLPWKWDFNHDEDVPLTWVGGRVRYILREVDGERVAVKRDLIPTRPGQAPTKLGTRSQLWMGPIDLSNYTVQADVLGTIKDNKMPDIGLINQRYVLELQGASQKLRIQTWATQYRLRMWNHPDQHAVVDFPWKPNTWYTMKVTTHAEGDRMIVRGKVWPRGDAEPEEWTLEAVDTAPNTHGSPGLYGNTKDTEFYIDNILVTPNE